jgi:hypothetical protein
VNIFFHIFWILTYFICYSKSLNKKTRVGRCDHSRIRTCPSRRHRPKSVRRAPCLRVLILMAAAVANALTNVKPISALPQLPIQRRLLERVPPPTLCS